MKIMAISAHPADFCSRSGGTLIKHVRAGDRVKVLWLTHGETKDGAIWIFSTACEFRRPVLRPYKPTNAPAAKPSTT